MERGFSLGVVISIVASVCCSVGFLLQKLSHLRKGVSAGATRHRYCNVLWISGMACLVLASALDYFALAFVAQSIVAPLGAVTLVCNLFLGPLLLREKLTSGSIHATAVIIVGNLISITFFSSSKGHSTILSAVVVARISEFDMIAYLVASAALFVAFYRRNTRLSLTIAAGMISATSMMAARMLSLMTKDALLDGAVQNPVFISGAVLIMILTAFAQLRQIDYCLQRFEATYVVPVSQSSMCLCSIAHGMFFFKEYRGLGPVQFILFCIGVAVTMRGQFILSRIGSADALDAKSGSVEIQLEDPGHCWAQIPVKQLSFDEENVQLKESNFAS